LAATRITKAQNPDDHVILPEVISKEPLVPLVRTGDDEWLHIVRWVIYALVDAEEKGVTSKNVDQMLGSDDPAAVRRGSAKKRGCRSDLIILSSKFPAFACGSVRHVSFWHDSELVGGADEGCFRGQSGS
jgi:hypothetical protein